MSEETVAHIALRVHPGAKKNAVVGKRADAWKIALQAPPLDGRANRACIDYLAKLLGVKRSVVSILKGEKIRDKIIEIKGLTSDEASAALKTASEA
ncbi:MAG: DUF167 domain-containing protein [Acidobacteria bacterium]|nr:DUF167 domain-containing protein [Acidobacteriota bacterium]